MSLTTLEGVLIALVVVLPGAIGIELRSYLWSGRDGAVTERLISSIAFSIAALLILEFLTAFVGIFPRRHVIFGDFILRELVAAKDPIARSSPGVWGRYLVLALVAAGLPSLLRIRKSSLVLKLKRTEHLSLESVGFEALFEESVKEASKWDDAWTRYTDGGLHVMVETEDDRRFQGEMMWRSTAPDPPELILISVKDVTDSASPVSYDALVLFRERSIRRLWILKPNESQSSDAASTLVLSDDR